MRRVASRPLGEDGVSLVEVILYSGLTALTLTVLGGVFAAGLQTQAAARDRDAAAGAAQVATTSLQVGIHNASAVLVTGNVLKARVATGTTGWQCAAWALTPDNKLVYRAEAGPITSTDYSAWTVLVAGASGRLGGGAAFSGDSSQVSFSLGLGSGAATVPVAGVAVPGAYGPGSPVACW